MGRTCEAEGMTPRTIDVTYLPRHLDQGVLTAQGVLTRLDTPGHALTP